MEEAEVNSEVQEVAPQEAETETPEEQPKQLSRDEYQERNWSAMRQKMADLERAVREKDELIAKAIISKAQPQQEEEEIDPEEYASYGGVQKVAKKTLQPIEEKLQKVEQELATYRQRALFDSLRTKFPDFDEIVNPETIAIFEKKEPELAREFAEEVDPYKMGIKTYKYIKALNIAEEVPNARRQKEAKKMLEKNAKTVQSPQAYDKRPMAQAFRLTEADKTKLYEEMMGYASLSSSVPHMG